MRLCDEANGFAATEHGGLCDRLLSRKSGGCGTSGWRWCGSTSAQRYRRSAIGMGWSLLHPIAMTTVLCMVLCLLFHADVRTYAPFVLTGLTFWGFIMASVSEGCQCFFQGESYIRQHKIPLAIYRAADDAGRRFSFSAGLRRRLGVLVWSVKGFGNLPALLSLAPTFVLLFVAGWSLAICMGLANVMFQDSQHLIEVVMQMMFYMTPIIYTPAQVPKGNLFAAWILYINPLAAFLELLRRPFLRGPASAAGDGVDGRRRLCWRWPASRGWGCGASRNA